MKHAVFFRLVETSSFPAMALDNSISISDPSIMETNAVLVDEATLFEALQFVSACEQCAENASITFDYLLDEITGCDPTITSYVLTQVAKCPGCSRDVTENTRVVAR